MKMCQSCKAKPCDLCHESAAKRMEVPIRDIVTGEPIMMKQICMKCADAVTTASMKMHVIEPAKGREAS